MGTQRHQDDVFSLHNIDIPFLHLLSYITTKSQSSFPSAVCCKRVKMLRKPAAEKTKVSSTTTSSPLNHHHPQGLHAINNSEGLRGEADAGGVMDLEQPAMFIAETQLQQQQRLDPPGAFALPGWYHNDDNSDQDHQGFSSSEHGNLNVENNEPHANQENETDIFPILKARVVNDDDIRNEIRSELRNQVRNEIMDEIGAITPAEEIRVEPKSTQKWRKWMLLVGIVILVVSSVIVAVVVAVVVPRDEDNVSPQVEIGTNKCFQTTDELRRNVDIYLLDKQSNTTVALTYGWPIGAWCVSNVQDFSQLFSYSRNPAAITFNENISGWDTSNAVNTSLMFAGEYPHSAHAFNQALLSWDVSSVTDMSGMFGANRAFNQDLSSWEVSSVTNVSYMFADADAFNQNLSSWNVSQVTNMSYMFSEAKVFNNDVALWDVSSVTDMSVMFGAAPLFNQRLSSWNVSSVTNMTYMFAAATNFNQNLASWDVSSATNMFAMFLYAFNFNQDLCSWGPVLSKTTAVWKMFSGSACTVQSDPVLSAVPPGPFCNPC